MSKIEGGCLCGAVEATPSLDWLKAGTLVDNSWVKTALDVWCSSAQPWVQLPDGIAQFPQNPPPA